MKFILAILITLFYSLTPAFAQKDEHGHEHKENESHVKNTNEKHADEGEHSDHEGEEDHEHKEGEESHADHEDHEEHDDHGEEGEGHAHGDEEEEEGSSVVGPDKGILEKGKEGFKLAPEAMKTFELKTEDIRAKVTEIIRPALVEIKNDKFIYRLRDGWIKKVSVKVLKKDNLKVTVDISQFKDGDQIIINGVGFVRTAELVAEEGVAHGHSH